MNAQGNGTITAIALDGANVVAQQSSTTGGALYLPIKTPRLWSPDDTFLYDLNITLKEKIEIARVKAVDAPTTPLAS